jgi:hypothetical protein
MFATLHHCVFGIFLALLEIEIEGKHGWAKNLPTWRKNKDVLVSFFYEVSQGIMMLSISDDIIFESYCLHWFFWMVGDSWRDDDTRLFIWYWWFTGIFYGLYWILISPTKNLNKNISRGTQTQHGLHDFQLITGMPLGLLVRSLVSDLS